MTDQAIVRAVVGLRGYGKTTKVVALARDFPRVLYYDTMGDDYKDGVICRDPAVLERVWKGVYRLPNFRVVYRPPDPIAVFPRFCRLAWESSDKDHGILVVVDELQLYSHGPWSPPEFTQIVTGGRHRGIELIGVTQAPKKLGELFRSQAHEWFVFGTREPDQADYLSERLPGIKAEVFQTLPKFQYIHWIDGAEEVWAYSQAASGDSQKLHQVVHYAETAAPPAGGASDSEHAPSE